jgi:transposase
LIPKVQYRGLIIKNTLKEATMKPFSEDLRQRIVQIYEENTWSYEEVAARFQVSVGSVRRYVRQWRNTGHLTPAAPGGGYPMKLDTAAQQWLVEGATNQVDASQGELCQEVQAHTGLAVSQPTVCRILQRAGITRKKRPNGPQNRTGRR